MTQKPYRSVRFGAWFFRELQILPGEDIFVSLQVVRSADAWNIPFQVCIVR
jgi:hypothetical protein